MNKRYAVLLSVCSIIVIIVASLIWYVEIPKSQNFSTSDASSIVWQTDIPHFATSIAAADGKAFVTDDVAFVQCFYGNSGNSVWNTRLSYANYGGGPQVQVYEGKVYASQEDGIVVRLNMNTGASEMKYQAPPRYINNYKRLPSYFLADGKVFATNLGTAAFDAATGQKLWTHGFMDTPVNGTSVVAPSNYIYIEQSSGEVARLDPNNGDTLWTFDYGMGSSLITQNQIILSNYALNYSYPQNEHAIVCLDKFSGHQLWRVDTDTLVFQPTVENGLLLFGAQDGYFYALDMADGSLKWKTYFDSSGILANNQSTDEYSMSGHVTKPLVDVEEQRVFWDLFLTYNNNHNDTLSKSLGAATAFDLQSGDIKWNTPLNCTLRDGIGNGGMALLNNELFISGNSGLLCLNADTGSVQWERTFEHQLSAPIVSGNRVFVAADLYLIAYK